MLKLKMAVSGIRHFFPESTGSASPDKTQTPTDSSSGNSSEAHTCHVSTRLPVIYNIYMYVYVHVHTRTYTHT